MEVFLDDVRFSLPAAEVTPGIGQQLLFVTGAAPAQGIGLDILVQQFIRIQLRTVTWQEKQTDPVFMNLQPIPNLSRPMHGMAIHNQKHPACILPYQATQEILEHPGGELLPKDHEVELTPVGDRRNHVAAESPPGHGNNRCLSLPAIGATYGMIGSQSHLVSQ